MMLKKVLKFFGMASLLSCLALGASSCSDDDESVSVGTGTVSGFVTDEMSNPLSDVTVSLHDSDLKTSTSSNGEFTLAGVPMNSQIITFEKDGYETTSVTVTAAKYSKEAVATVSVSMVFANARIIGTVTDAATNGGPLAGVNVSVSANQSDITKADGTFEIRNLVMNDYTVTFAKDGYPSITRNISMADFIDGVATLEVQMGAEEILPGLTKFDLMMADKWYYSEYRGGRNAEQYPHWDWACNYMCSLDFRGDWEEQNEGTTLRIKNGDADQKNPANTETFDSFVYGSKLITDDTKIMTLEMRTHSTSADAPAYYGVQVVDLSAAEPKAVLVGGVRTLDQTDGSYVQVPVDLSEFIGKEVIIAIGTFRQQTGDYWKQLVLRRIAFTAENLTSLWCWLPGTGISGLEEWKLTQEMVRGTMPHTKKHFTGISPVSGNRDSYVNAYRAWRDVAHIASEWSFMPLTKDPEVFPGEGYLIKTRSGKAVDTRTPESYYYAKFAVAPGNNKLTLRTRNFSSTYATFFKVTAITNDGQYTFLSPASNTATMAEASENGCWKFIHESGDAGNPDGYASFVYDLSDYNGKDVTIVIGIHKGEENDAENKLVFYSIDMN